MVENVGLTVKRGLFLHCCLHLKAFGPSSAGASLDSVCMYVLSVDSSSPALLLSSVPLLPGSTLAKRQADLSPSVEVTCGIV